MTVHSKPQRVQPPAEAPLLDDQLRVDAAVASAELAETLARLESEELRERDRREQQRLARLREVADFD